MMKYDKRMNLLHKISIQILLKNSIPFLFRVETNGLKTSELNSHCMKFDISNSTNNRSVLSVVYKLCDSIDFHIFSPFYLTSSEDM